MLALIELELGRMWKFWRRKQNHENDRLTSSSEILAEPTAEVPSALEAKEDTPTQELMQQVDLCLDQSPEQALALLQQAIALTPANPTLWEKKGLALQKLGRIEEAIAANRNTIQLSKQKMGSFAIVPSDVEFQTKKQIHPPKNISTSLLFKSISEPEQQQSISYFEEGNQFFILGRYEEASNSYAKFLEVQPGNDEAWTALGNSLHHLGRHEEAISSFEKSLEIKPDNDTALTNCGISLSNLERYEEAIASYDKALEVKPDDYVTWNNRGNALERLGRYQEAIVNYGKAIEIKSDFETALYNRGTALLGLGRYEEAIVFYDKATEIKLNYEEAWYNRGLSLYYLSRYEEAILSYDKALEVKLDDDKAWANRGLAALWSHKFNISLISRIAARNNKLNQRGFEGQLASIQEGINAVEHHSKCWAKLYQALGNAYFEKAKVERGRSHPYQSYIELSILNFQTALDTFRTDKYKWELLECYQDYLQILIVIEDIKTTTQIYRDSLDLYRRLLNQAETLEAKQRLEGKFSGLSQIAIDSLLIKNEPILALEAAERYKNRCLTQILDTWKERITSPSYSEMREILHQYPAVIYWYLSPVNLTTFILLPQAANPIVLLQPILSFEEWQRKWNQSYNNYRSKGKEQNLEKQNHSWKSNLKSGLAQLKTILQIEKIKALLPSDVQILLVPHRDLHRFPIHILFENRTYSDDKTAYLYLPSIQFGLSQKKHPNSQFLLNIHDPQRPDQSELEFAALESALIEAMLAPQVKTISRERADLETVQSALQSHQGICHFTGHSEYQSAKPENSALGLANQDLLTAENIAALNLKNYHLVCLSACETALTGRKTIYRDYVGLASAFLQAGASQVISTCWTVPEISSTFLMVRFYQFLQQNDAANALQKAQTWLRQVTAIELADWLDALRRTYAKRLDPLIIQEIQQQAYHFRNEENASTMDSHTPPFADPYHWAAFTLTGRGPR